MASIHDSLLVGYTVDGNARTIVLRTIPDRGMGGAFEVRFPDVVQFAARRGARWFELTCSYGMGGWVAAAAMTIVPAPVRG